MNKKMHKENKKIVVGIIGGTGQMGQWFKRFFEENGCKALISGRKTELSQENCAKMSDVVIITVPIDATVETIKKVAPFVRKEALLMDLTSLKQEPVEAMLRYSKSSVIGTHPVFGPSVKTLRNQTVVLCKGRDGEWFKWLKEILEKNGAKIKITTPEKHDKVMAIIQGITHFSIMSVAYAMKELKMDVKESLEFSSPIYKLRMDMVGRILNQDPNLYADIEIVNKKTREAIKVYIDSAKKLQSIIEANDKKAFISYFKEASEHLGNFRKEAEEYSNYIIEKLVERKK